ncbi:MAG: tRNA threonylcarbamoyladenosine biosynthesis protein TsaE [Planctomycetes bacterium ADurb.Bin401]|nr:MAG: tRNA threonylcarbamoyladenosine biosynthesis protein TsaE [Planctomycetes bacterium ADurb.Bin401]
MANKKTEIISESVEQTLEIGRKIGSLLEGGKVISLVGQLGSGKTTLIKGIAAGMGAKSSQIVNSPTFVIVNEYQGRLNIFHIDAYRINTIEEFAAIGFEDFIGPESIVLVEWADKVSQALEGYDLIQIRMQHKDQNTRIIEITGLERI